jgi:hypothetical protein
MFDSYVAAGIEGEEGAFQELAVVERADTSAGVQGTRGGARQVPRDMTWVPRSAPGPRGMDGMGGWGADGFCHLCADGVIQMR